jgi:hypothetical protein
MADAVKHAIVAMICAKHLSLFFTVLVLEFKFKSNSKWMMKTITTTTKPRMPFSLFSATRKANQTQKSKQQKVTLLLRCVIGVLPTASFASPALR